MGREIQYLLVYHRVFYFFPNSDTNKYFFVA